MKSVILKSLTVALVATLTILISGCTKPPAPEPTFLSPNGKYIAYYSEAQLVIKPNDGKDIKSFPVVEPISWLPDSSGVLVGEYHVGINRLEVSGKSETLLETFSGNYDHSPTVSRDGKWVYFLHHERGTECTLERIKTKDLIAKAGWEKCEDMAKFTTDSDEHVGMWPCPDGRMQLSYSKGVFYFDLKTGKMAKK